MKSTGIIRGIDALGRIVLPKELRTTLHIDPTDKMEIFVDGETILLKKYRPAGSCDFCGEIAPDVKSFGGFNICPSCRQKISEL